jgi:uncharacterized protein with GYD domain
MATYIVLTSFTEQGVKNVKETVKRADAFKEMAKKCGATVREVYWTLGRYDIVAIVDAKDDESITALGLSVGGRGNVRTETLRAFSAAEMEKVLGKMV